MPVTARLSKKFYDRFGDDIAGEFVDWFNAVDTTYQQQLRDHNDQNWERLKAELHSAIAQSEGRTIERIGNVETRIGERVSQLEIRMFGQNTDFETRVSNKFSEMMKWMFIYWSGTVVSLGALMIALLRK